MTPTQLHELNKLAGEFCGKELEEVHLNSVSRWFYTNERGRCVSWNPCVKHDQAAEVKAMLREKGCDMLIAVKKNYVMVMIFAPSEGMWEGQHESELIALLLAVEALRREEV